MDSEKQIIRLLKNLPDIQTADDFTPRVMAAVNRERQGAFVNMRNLFSRHWATAFSKSTPFPTEGRIMELVWHFLIAGFMYAIIGTFMLIGFSSIKNITTLSGWISFQPYLWLASAALFLACGVALHRGMRHGMTLVRFYMAFHIVMTIINGIFISLSSALPLTIMYTVLFATPIVLVGSTLFVNNLKFKKLFSQGEILNHAIHHKS